MKLLHVLIFIRLLSYSSSSEPTSTPTPNVSEESIPTLIMIGVVLLIGLISLGLLLYFLPPLSIIVMTPEEASEWFLMYGGVPLTTNKNEAQQDPRHKQEFNLLHYRLSSARVFFQTDDAKKSSTTKSGAKTRQVPEPTKD